MLIELQEPFKSKWKKGYLRTNKEDRNVVDLFNNNNDRTTISYARYLMGVKLGYEVPNNYEVDHINNNRTDDRIENLQLLTPEQNLLKQQWWVTAMVVNWTILPCTYCKELFYITERELKNRRKQGREHEFCSRSCAAKFHNTISKNSTY